MASIDRAKALHNAAFGDAHLGYAPVTTLHPDGGLTSGGYSVAATTRDVHDLALDEPLGVSTHGLKGLLENLRDDAPQISVEGAVLRLTTDTQSYSIGLTEPKLAAAPAGLNSKEEIDASDPAIARILKIFPLFTSRDIGRQNMHSLFFTPTGVTALDGYQIANWAGPLTKLVGSHSLQESHIRTALKNFDDFKIRFGDGKVVFYDDETRWIVSTLEGEAKDYSKLIPPPAEASTYFKFDASFAKSVLNVSKAADSSNVFLDIEDGKLLVSANADVSSAKDVVEIQIPDDVTPGAARMKFNAKMLLNSLKAGLEVHDEPVFHMFGKRSAATVSALSSSFTLMAMDATR